jgi:C4-type Zn-finger protein
MVTKEQQEKIEDFEMCPECLALFEDEDFIMEYESVPYGSTTASYPVLIGVICHNCGYKEQI